MYRQIAQLSVIFAFSMDASVTQEKNSSFTLDSHDRGTRQQSSFSKRSASPFWNLEPKETTVSPGAQQYVDTCMKSDNHKARPGPEPELHGQVLRST
jgi:hypothetical protein